MEAAGYPTKPVVMKHGHATILGDCASPMERQQLSEAFPD